jgi:hypothetical protein
VVGGRKRKLEVFPAKKQYVHFTWQCSAIDVILWEMSIPLALLKVSLEKSLQTPNPEGLKEYQHVFWL